MIGEIYMKQKEEGFVPVQYKILKLSSRMIINAPNREHEKKEKGSGEIEFYSIPEIPLIDWLTKSYGDSGLVTIGDNILFQKIREVVSPETTIDENGEDITPNEQQYRAYLKLKEMRKEIKKLKRKANEHPTEGRINAINDKIMDMEKFLFFPYVISVETNKTGYDKFSKKGFYYNGKKYVRRSASSGNLKQNTVLFIQEDILDKVLPKIRVGFQIDVKTSEILPPSKFGAYEGLTTTGCIFVRKPRVVVIPDFEYITFKDKNNKNHLVYFVKKNKDEDSDSFTYDIDTRPFFETKWEEDENGNIIHTAYLNSFDGMGLITPTFAEKWAKDLHINYIPSAFNARSIGVKGLLVTFPIMEYAMAKGFKTIVDVRYKGMSEDEIEYIPIEDVDVILTESQWKYKKLYKSDGMGCNFDLYNSNPEAIWGVQRVAPNPKDEKDCVRQNYQLTTTSNVREDEDIDKLIVPTEKYLRLLAEGKPEYILYALAKDIKDLSDTEDEEDMDDEESDIDCEEDNGADNEDVDAEEKLKTTTLNNALLKNPDLIKDKYVGGQIQKIIKSYLNRAKAGKLYPDGNSNYQFMISDPYALCQWAFNWYYWMDEKGGISDSHKHRATQVARDIEANGIGLIPPNAVYSSYWQKKKGEKIDACRSPMTDIAEHNILTVCNKDNIYKVGITPEIYDEMERYYRFIKSGIIYSLHDLSTVKHSDSDFDSDMVCTFDSKVYINNAWDVYPTTYEKGVDNMTPKKYDITEATESDKQGFGNKVGVYSNMSTSLFAMMPLFPVDEEKAEITVDENGNKVVKHPEYLHHTDPNYPEYDCSVGQLELFKTIKKDRFLIGEEIDSTKTGVKPKLSQEFKIANWKEQKDEIRRSTQKEKEKYAERLQESNKYIPNYLPYFFINVKSNYKDKYTKYQSRMRDICKMYTFESIDTFVKDVIHGKRELVTEDEKYFWNYYKDNCPLLITDCLMNKICWKLEIFEEELDKTMKEKWKSADSYILMNYAKEVKVTPSEKKFIKSTYEKFVSELMKIYSKKNHKSTEKKTQIFTVSKLDALIFDTRTKLLKELKVGFAEIFDMLVSVLKEYPKSKYTSINNFIWKVMGDDILDVIPYSKKKIDFATPSEAKKYTDNEPITILGKDIVFWEEDRNIEEEEDD